MAGLSLDCLYFLLYIFFYRSLFLFYIQLPKIWWTPWYIGSLSYCRKFMLITSQSYNNPPNVKFRCVAKCLPYRKGYILIEYTWPCNNIKTRTCNIKARTCNIKARTVNIKARTCNFSRWCSALHIILLRAHCVLLVHIVWRVQCKIHTT